MAFDALQVKAVEGFNKFYKPAANHCQIRVLTAIMTIKVKVNTIGHRSTGASSTWCGREKEIGEKEMNKFKRQQQPHLTKVTFYSSSNLEIHHKLL